MGTPPPVKSYMAQLQEAAARNGVPLLQAFLAAGIADSTYYRALRTGQIRFETAEKVADALERMQRTAA